MEGILKFSLPEEYSLMELHMKALDYSSAIEDFRNQLRRWDKNDEVISLEKVTDAFYKIFEGLLE